MGYKIIRRLLLFLTPKKFKTLLAHQAVEDFKKKFELSLLSYSQEGEDLILNRFLGKKEKGFYVDIGAHDPKRFSNTNIFYERGWTGINIDPLPGVMEKFKSQRPEDINLEIGVSIVEQELDYYMFNEPALNTFSKAEAKKKDGLGIYKIIEEKKIKTYSLKYILDTYLNPETTIDFMNIDVEGLDLEVLRSNDWDKYRPDLLLVEDLKKQSLEKFIHNSEMHTFLKKIDYLLVAKTFNTLFFKDNRV